MGRGRRTDPRHRGSDGKDRLGTRGSRDEPWDVQKSPAEDPFRSPLDRDPDQPDPADEDYIWPEQEEENDDIV